MVITLSHVGLSVCRNPIYLFLLVPLSLISSSVVSIVYLWYLVIVTFLGFSVTVIYLLFCAQWLVQCWPLEVASG